MESSSGANVLAEGTEDESTVQETESQCTDSPVQIGFGGRLVLVSCTIELVFVVL